MQYCTPLCREKAMPGVAAGMLRSQHRFITAPSFIPVSREKQRGAAWLQSCLWSSEFGCCEERQPFSPKLRTPLPRSVSVQSRTTLAVFVASHVRSERLWCSLSLHYDVDACREETRSSQVKVGSHGPPRNSRSTAEVSSRYRAYCHHQQGTCLLVKSTPRTQLPDETAVAYGQPRRDSPCGTTVALNRLLSISDDSLRTTAANPFQ